MEWPCVDTDVELTQLPRRSRPSLILPEPSAVLRLRASGGGSTWLQHMDQFGTSANTQCTFWRCRARYLSYVPVAQKPEPQVALTKSAAATAKKTAATIW